MAQQMNFGITNLEMEKQRLLDLDGESLQLICVNPYDVNPVITQQNTVSHQISTDVPSKDEPSTSHVKSPAISGGEFYVPREKKIKLEMEEFSDLSFYLHRKPKSLNSVDELNATFYDTNLPGYDLNFDLIKLESESYGNNIFLNNIYKTTNSIDIEKMNNNEYPISDIDNIQLQNSVTKVVSPESDNGSVYDHPNSKSYISGKTFNILDHHGAPSLSGRTETATMYSNASSPSALDIRPMSSGVTSPESSICSSNRSTPQLSLNVNLKPPGNFDLTTPSIIEDVVELENVNFNLLEYVQNEGVSCETVKIEDLLEPLYSKPPISGKGKAINRAQLQPHIARKRPRKRRALDEDDDDEDYVPPGEKIASKKRLPSEDYSDSDSDDEVEIERKVKNKTRGRPPKRTGSISSDCSKDSDASKYRELRDKNNEASRRSRLKRKLKEQELEGEADELYSKNIKLKAQVEELEKLVTKFREDLFKIMIRK